MQLTEGLEEEGDAPEEEIEAAQRSSGDLFGAAALRVCAVREGAGEGEVRVEGSSGCLL
jgi:hypothetical protein